MKLHHRIARAYACGSPIEKIRDIDLIVPLSYSTLPHQLTAGTQIAAELAAFYQKDRFPGAPIAFTNAIHSEFPECDARERELKKKLLGSAWLVPDIPSAHNSISEAEVIRASLESSLRPGSRILVICGEMHSRRVRYIWEKVFPEMKIIIRTFMVDFEYQKDHPALVERYRWVWIAGSIVGEWATRILGIERMRGARHITSQSA